ncbi:MAG: CHASE2 domain-containing protein [Lacunisphaera sp.]|nr:CHASE2 domain-containing protein [Lacunisphaera sp.]
MALTVGKTLRQTWWVPLLCYGLALWLSHTETLQLAEARTLDWRTRYRAFFQPPPDPRIVIALFEDGTEANMAPWPVDRAWHGQLNKFLAAEKAAVVSWDVILDASREGDGDRAMARDTRQAIQDGTRVVVGASTSSAIVEVRPGAEGPTQPLTTSRGISGVFRGKPTGCSRFPNCARPAGGGRPMRPAARMASSGKSR